MTEYDSVVHHYPPEVMELLISTIPRLCRSKTSVLTFFEGAGVPDALLDKPRDELARDPSVKKTRIARVVLTALNEDDESPMYLRARREIIKRVCQFEDFSLCWPDDQLAAKGFVADLRRIVNVKDSFSRMEHERTRERQERMREREAEANTKQRRERESRAIKNDLFSLFAEQDAQKRGMALESVLNRLFKHEGILVRESFQRRSSDSGRVLEQIDGVVELGGRVFIVEMKWLSERADVDDISRHVVRVHTRPDAHGILISYSAFTEAAVQVTRDVLSMGRVHALCMLQEVIQVLENGTSLERLLQEKVQAVIVDKNPFLDRRV